MCVAALHGAPRNARHEFTLEDKRVGIESANSKLRGFAAGEDERLRGIRAECRTNPRSSAELEAEAENTEAVGVAWIEFLELELSDRMRRSGDEQCSRCMRDERFLWASTDESGEGLRQSSRPRVEQAGEILSGAGQSIEIGLG